MRLTWSEIRANAARFSAEHAGDSYEKGQTQTFYNEFFACFGVDRKQVAVYEQRVKNLPGDRKGFIDLFMPGKLIVEQKSAGLDLRIANDQALNYYEGLPEAIKPRYILVCDFQRFELLDLVDRREWRFPLADLKKHVEAFAFIVGVETRQFRNQKPANPKASALLGKLHRQLEEDGYSGHKLQLLLVRLLFILFADDTGIWPKDQFLVWLEQRTQPDGRDLGEKLTALFGVLDTAPDDRQRGLDGDLSAFPHINGALFRERIDTATFNNALRDILLEASDFTWGEVSPAIFGALFESVIDKVTRRKQGAHYTPEEAIQKVIGPLFLDDLYSEFEAVKARKDGGRARALEAFHAKIAALTFFDPACGAGNFLVVAYREMRELERLLLKEIHPPESRQMVLDVTLLSQLNVNQMFGIEIDEFPSQIAQVALWMTDHIANTNLGDDFGKPFARVPLVTAPNIRHGDALEIDWADVLPPGECSYVFGNPPFVGSKQQSDLQRQQVKRIARLGGSGGTLDYVAAWFIKAGRYVNDGSASMAFVATNSICQGEQVAQLWPILFERCALEITFAHGTFRWPGRAAVHCVIVGLCRRGAEPENKRLFSYPTAQSEPIATRPTLIGPYLFEVSPEFRYFVVKEESRAINDARRLKTGVQMIDDGHYTFENSERAAFLAVEPEAEPLFRQYLGGDEYINGFNRWILYLAEAAPDQLRNLPMVRERISRVRKYRSGSSRLSTIRMAETPTLLGVDERLSADYLVVPNTSSENRNYIPIGWLGTDAIANQKLRILADATPWEFGILTSQMHMAWMRAITGRMKSDYMYSVGVVYNTFPWPVLRQAQDERGGGQRAKIEALAQAVLDARALPKNATSTLADLYDPDRMPAELYKAHKALDAAVDRLYAPKGFSDDRARVEHLFRRYEALVMPTAAAPAANRRTERRVARASK
jgi:hypothetical protein